MLDVKLRHLPEWIAHRRRIAAAYHRGLTGIPQLQIPQFDEARHQDIFQNYVVRTGVRDQLRAYLKEQGIETLVHWQKPMWEHTGLGLAAPDVPETLSICREVLSLPMSAETTAAQVDVIVAAVRAFFSTQP